MHGNALLRRTVPLPQPRPTGFTGKRTATVDRPVLQRARALTLGGQPIRFRKSSSSAMVKQSWTRRNDVLKRDIGRFETPAQRRVRGLECQKITAANMGKKNHQHAGRTAWPRILREVRSRFVVVRISAASTRHE